MTTLLSKRALALKPSATGALAAKAGALQAAGKSLFRFDIGMPGDGWLPAEIYAAEGDKALLGKYPPSNGALELREAICSYLKRIPKLTYTADEVVCTAGGKDALFKIVGVLINAGDKVAYPSPYWVSYPDIVSLWDGESVTIPATSAQNYKITPAQLDAALATGVKLFIFNQPSNPTGMLYSKDELVALGAILAKYPTVQIFEDAIYDGLVYAGEYHSFASTCPNLLDRIFYAHSASKVLAMPEERIGSVASKNAEVLKKIIALNSQTIMGLPPKSAAMATAAYSSDLAFLAPIKAELLKKRDVIIPALNAIDGVSCPTPQGAFYASPDISSFFGTTAQVDGKTITVENDMVFADIAMNKYNLAILPGSASGDGNSVRLAFARATMAQVDGALDAFKSLCTELTASRQRKAG